MTPGASGSRWSRPCPCRPGRARPSCTTLYDWALGRLEEFAAEGAKPIDEPVIVPPDRDDELPPARRRTSPELYAAAVEAAREHIYAGDIFQVVLAQRFDLDLEAKPFDLYRSLRQVNPSPYMYLLQYPELAVVGSSPEPMVRVRDGQVISRPIAGTRRRGRTDADDRRLAAELAEHPKERAEHVMLVDLARNDVGRVVEFGTRDRGRADDARALQPRDAPDVPGVGPPAAGPGAGRRAAGHAARRARCRARPR